MPLRLPSEECEECDGLGYVPGLLVYDDYEDCPCCEGD